MPEVSLEAVSLLSGLPESRGRICLHSTSPIPCSGGIGKLEVPYCSLQNLRLNCPIQSKGLAEKTFCSVGICTYPLSDAESHSHVEEERYGVLLLNLGGPDTLRDVRPFLYNLFADPDIIRLPRLFRFLQRPLAQLISVLRARKSKEAYASIGGGSPLRKITDEQADALKTELEAKKVSANVYVAMRYWHPFTEEAAHQAITSIT
ncbi:ferrochelatase-2, chloroplastic-like protein [Tanacetum coccineum]